MHQQQDEDSQPVWMDERGWIACDGACGVCAEPLDTLTKQNHTSLRLFLLCLISRPIIGVGMFTGLTNTHVQSLRVARMVDANERTPSFLIAPWAFTTASQCSLTSLKFSDKALEQAYTESTVGSTYPPLDSSLCLQKLLVSLALVACIAVGALEATPVGRAVWCLYISMLAGHLALMKLLPEFYRQKRRLLIIPIKLCLAATLASFVPTFVLKQVHSTAAYAEVLVLGSGLVLQLCTGNWVPG